MRCNRMKRWISDLLDGRLDETKKAVLEKHFSQCQSCRMYREHLEMIRSSVSAMEKTPISPQYREDFSIRLKKQLLSVEKENKPAAFFNRRWIYWPAAASLALCLILVLLVFQPRPPSSDEFYPFSIGGSLTDIYSDISASLELEEIFNSLVLASIDEALEDLDWNGETFILENPLDDYFVTEQDLRWLESKIKEDLDI